MRWITHTLLAALTTLIFYAGTGRANTETTTEPEPPSTIKALIASGRLEDALKLVDSALKASRNNGTLYFLKGRIHQEQRNNLEAFKDYSIALFLQPDMTKAYINRGLVRGALMDLNGAVEDFNNALRLDPSSQPALVNRGVTYASLNNIPKALEDLNKAVSFNSSLTDAYVNRGILQHLTGDKARSCEDWRKAARLGSREASEWAAQLCKT